MIAAPMRAAGNTIVPPFTSGAAVRSRPREGLSALRRRRQAIRPQRNHGRVRAVLVRALRAPAQQPTEAEECDPAHPDHDADEDPAGHLPLVIGAKRRNLTLYTPERTFS